jgi:hypothetical protein
MDGDDEDYVDTSGDGTTMIPCIMRSKADISFLAELKISSDSARMESTLQEYLGIAQAIQFMFRLDVPIQAKGRHFRGIGNGHLTQCISSPLSEKLA